MRRSPIYIKGDLKCISVLEEFGDLQSKRV